MKTFRNICYAVIFICFLSVIIGCKSNSVNATDLKWAPGTASNADKPIISQSDPSQITHRITSKNVTLGFNKFGGGYVTEFDTGDGINLVMTDYGKGWQSSIRDSMHGGRHNPTQAGFRDPAGAEVELNVTNNRLFIPKFNLPLYSDPVYDFTEHEDLYRDFERYPDAVKIPDNAGLGNKDMDNIDESGLSQDDEVRSEFDYSCIVEAVDKQTYKGIPGFRFSYYYVYAREPKQILQFNSNSVRYDDPKRLVFDPSWRMKDISVEFPGDQTPEDTDYSSVRAAFGIRLNKSVSKFNYPMWWSEGKWEVQNDVSGQRVQLLDYSTGEMFQYVSSKKVARFQKDCELPFVVISDGTDPEKSNAIGMYFPQSHGFNKESVRGIDKNTGEVIYSEDRRINHQITFEDNGRQVVLRSVIHLAGLLSPVSKALPVADTIEGFWCEVYILYGTPNEILKSVIKFENIK